MKTTQRNGKIARLPRVVREELNQRIEDGELGDGIVRWVNELPAVREMVGKEWEGRGISEQNLSAWRNGGYRDWVEQRQVMELAVRLSENAGELKDSCQPLGETMAAWVAARLMVMTRRWEQVEDAEEKWKLLRGMSAEVARVRRGDREVERTRTEQGWLVFEKEKLEVEREKKRKATEAEMMAWAMKEENRAKIAEGFVSRAEKITLIRRAYFADVDHPVNGAEVAVGIALTDMKPTDPGFGRRVAELFVSGMLKNEDEAAALDDFVKELAAERAQGENIEHPTSNTQHPMEVAPNQAEGGAGPAPVDQGGSRLVKVEEAEGAPRRHEDSKVGTEAIDVRNGGPEPEAVKADQGGSRLVEGEERRGSAVESDGSGERGNGEWVREIATLPSVGVGGDGK